MWNLGLRVLSKSQVFFSCSIVLRACVAIIAVTCLMFWFTIASKSFGSVGCLQERLASIMWSLWIRFSSKSQVLANLFFCLKALRTVLPSSLLFWFAIGSCEICGWDINLSYRLANLFSCSKALRAVLPSLLFPASCLHSHLVLNLSGAIRCHRYWHTCLLVQKLFELCCHHCCSKPLVLVRQLWVPVQPLTCLVQVSSKQKPWFDPLLKKYAMFWLQRCMKYVIASQSKESTCEVLRRSTYVYLLWVVESF